LIVVGVLTAVGLTLPSACPGLGADGPGSGPQGGSKIAEVAGVPVTSEAVFQQYQMAKQGQPSANSPMFELNTLGQSIDTALRDAALMSLASQKGLKVTDESAKKVVNQFLDEAFKSQRARLIADKKLKEGATEAEFVEAFKKENNGRSPDDVRKEQVDSVIKGLADPARKAGIEAEVLRTMLQDWYLASFSVTEEQVKASYDQLTVRRLTFQDPAKSAEANRKDAEAALSEAGGGANWAAVFAKYGKGQKDEPRPYGRAVMEGEEALKPLLELKAGGVTLIEEPGGVALYKLDKVENKPPADWATKKGELTEQYKRARASKKMESDIESAVKSAVWKDEGYRLTAEAAKEWRQSFGKSPAEIRETMEALIKQIDAVQPSDGLSRQGLALAKYVAFDSFFNQLTPKEQADLREQQVAALQAVLEFTESPEIRLKVYDSLLASEDWEAAGEALLDAATHNGLFDSAGETQAAQIRKRLEAAEKAGKIEKAALDAVKKELSDWEARKKEDEIARKEEEANQKKIEAELDKLDEPGANPKEGQPKAKSN
jgi:hypothetical protein